MVKTNIVKAKFEAEKLLSGSKPGETCFKAFDVVDESISKFYEKIYFDYGQYEMVGRVAVFNRINAFSVSF